MGGLRQRRRSRLSGIGSDGRLDDALLRPPKRSPGGGVHGHLRAGSAPRRRIRVGGLRRRRRPRPVRQRRGWAWREKFGAVHERGGGEEYLPLATGVARDASHGDERSGGLSVGGRSGRGDPGRIDLRPACRYGGGERGHLFGCGARGAWKRGGHNDEGAAALSCSGYILLERSDGGRGIPELHMARGWDVHRPTLCGLRPVPPGPA